MYCTSIKNICQVAGKCFIIAAFLCLLVPAGFGNAQALRDDRNKAVDDLVDGIIEKAKEAALNGLRTGEFKYLYDPKDPRSKDPANIALRGRLEAAAVALVEAGRDLMDKRIADACKAVLTDITSCPPFQNPAAFSSQLSDSVVNQFAAARQQGSAELLRLIAVTEAHTVQTNALAEINASLGMLASSKDGLLAERELVNGYIVDARKAQDELGFFERLGGGREKIEKGINDLNKVLLQISRMLAEIDAAIQRSNRIKAGIENGTLKGGDIDRAMAEARISIANIQSHGSTIGYILQWPDLVWLVTQYNIRNPNKPVDLAAIQQSIKDRLAPINAADKAMRTKEAQDKIDKLKKSLLIPGINPKLTLPQQLQKVVPCNPKPKAAGDKPTVGITGVDGIPPQDIMPNADTPVIVTLYDATTGAPVPKTYTLGTMPALPAGWTYQVTKGDDGIMRAEPVRPVDKSAMK